MIWQVVPCRVLITTNAVHMLPRRRQPELMDDPALDPAEHRRALAALARINSLSNIRPHLWRTIRSLVGGGPRDLSILDVATGSGDVAVGVARCAGSDAVRVALTLCDISAVALKKAAQRAALAQLACEPVQADVVRSGLPLASESVDVAMSSLFLHHLEDGQIVRVLSEMKRVARLGVVISDLRRCRRGLAAAWTVSRAITRSRIVHVDAVRSVQGALTIEELSSLAQRAGLEGARVHASWPFRMMLTWSRR